MFLTDRGVVIIKAKQPLLDWVNSHPDTTPLATAAEVNQDCSAYLIPEFDDEEERLAYIEPLKPLWFEVELVSWYRDETTWPQPRTNEMFDAWFELEFHSMVWDMEEEDIDREWDDPLADKL